MRVAHVWASRVYTRIGRCQDGSREEAAKTQVAETADHHTTRLPSFEALGGRVCERIKNGRTFVLHKSRPADHNVIPVCYHGKRRFLKFLHRT
jgi:hypothetical protein